MQRIIAMLLAAILLSGCDTHGNYSKSRTFDSSRSGSDKCDDQGGTHVNLIYDNHQIRTVAVARLRAGEIFSIRLKPKNDPEKDRKNVNYETQTVKISAKGGGPAWLSASGTYDTTPEPYHDLVICVPPGTANGAYYYKIEITGAGTLDPRADVY